MFCYTKKEGVSIEKTYIGKYRVLGVIGQGSTSKVYLVEDPVYIKNWAIKACLSESSDEAAVLGRLNYPGLPRLVDQIQEDGCNYLVMDYCKGETLHRRCTHKSAAPEEVARWGIQLCDVLSYLHEMEPPVLYRDLKPENVILSELGNLSLVDFGIAGSPWDYKKNHYGTKEFAAPEQFYGNASVQSDLYNLGATLLWCLGQQRCPGLRAILQHCMRKNPARRYKDARTLKSKFDIWLERKQP